MPHTSTPDTPDAGTGADTDAGAPERFTIEHRASESRYVLLDHGETASASGGDAGPAVEIGEESYAVTDFGERPQRVLYHTFVEPSYGGQGLASRLVRVAVDDSIAAGFDIVPVCPYVVKWLTKHHDEYTAHVVKATPQHLAAIKQ